MAIRFVTKWQLVARFTGGEEIVLREHKRRQEVESALVQAQKQNLYPGKPYILTLTEVKECQPGRARP